ASRSFRLGFVSIEARVDQPPGFLLESRATRLRIVRTSLDGVPRTGSGSWRIVRLEQPQQTILPADQPPSAWSDPFYGNPYGPRRRKETAPPVETPGDRVRPRWDTQYAPDQVIRAWKDGAAIANGDATHDAKGEASIEIPKLPAGAYRLRYTTVDEFGAVFEMPFEFLVGGKKTDLAVPAYLGVEKMSVRVGDTARFLVASGLPDQILFFDVYSAGRRIERRELKSGRSGSLVELPVAEKDRGGFSVKLSALRDHQWMSLTQTVFVPWDDKDLKISFATFRDKLRPGARETWRIKVDAPEGHESEHVAAELLAYMYDRSLDAFVSHYPPDPRSVYPNRTGADWSQANLGQVGFGAIRERFPDLPSYPVLRADSLKFYGGYAIGGPGRRGAFGYAAGIASAEAVTVSGEAPLAKAAPQSALAKDELKVEGGVPGGVVGGVAAAREAAVAPAALRSEFSETAFWQPHLLTDASGAASIEFTVPDSVTSWNVFVHAITKDWRAGSIRKETRSVKDLMVRPYVPRFLREGDRAELKIVVNNASEKEMSGKVSIDILDTETNATVLGEFGVSPETATQPFRVAAGGGTNVSVSLTAPRRLGLYAFKVTAVSGDTSDGELRPVPLLTSRFELAQSRFVTLHDADRREMTFADLAKNDDPTRVNEQLVLTVDAQLFYSALSALPYLVNYPYECTEQTLNRFVSTGIVSSLFSDYPAVAKMAEELSKRDTRLETWDSVDANRRMTLEETPWLEAAKGGRDTGNGLARVLDPRIAKAERDTAIAKLRKAQTESGGFPWWPGGPPSTYMTIYILHGFANLLEFGGEVPKDMVLKAWQYAGRDIRRDLDLCMHLGHYCPFVTFVNYTLSSYPDESWYKPAFDDPYRKILLDYSFAHWKEHSPYLKGELALTLKRMGRAADARLVWDSVMDSAKTERDLGTYWAPEDRSWLWYNDTIETQAFALRTLDELEPTDSRRAGLVQWLMLNKKLNQWKSTRATAEVIYSLAHYLRKEGALGVREDATVTVAGQKMTFVFEPDRYTGKKNQIVISGEKIDPKTAATVVVEKQGKGLAFASATWRFSTEKLPAENRGDFFAVSRRYFKRESTAQGFVLRPISEGAAVLPGDQVEVQISLRAKHAAEYVHLRDPRAAGLEPENVLSRYKWGLGISWYEETRDSGSNFFFEQLPAGEYTFKYRVRANMAGTFRVGPATVESMYAPEFVAYSAGDVLTVR
ncbi:MAG TPA: alpha-2-macroglobulin family protein, partial [Thermoanaerobaculia bacterium]